MTRAVPDRRKLLLVEDDPSFGMIMAAYLDATGYRTVRVTHGRDVFEHVSTGRFDAILLDLNLPDEDGLVIMRSLRARSEVPIVVVSGREGLDDRLTALQLGADDYLVKPFDPRELLARMDNILRRSCGVPRRAGNLFHIGPWELDTDQHMLRSERGSAAELTPAEFALLLALAKNHGRVMSRAQLIDAITSSEAPESERAIDVLISRLRKKIETRPEAPTLLLTIRNHGYRLAHAAQDAAATG